MEGGEGPREKEVAESGETDPALHDGESAQHSLQGTKGGHSLGLREWGGGNRVDLPSGIPERGPSSRKP